MKGKIKIKRKAIDCSPSL